MSRFIAGYLGAVTSAVGIAVSLAFLVSIFLEKFLACHTYYGHICGSGRTVDLNSIP